MWACHMLLSGVAPTVGRVPALFNAHHMKSTCISGCISGWYRTRGFVGYHHVLPEINSTCRWLSPRYGSSRWLSCSDSVFREDGGAGCWGTLRAMFPIFSLVRQLVIRLDFGNVILLVFHSSVDLGDTCLFWVGLSTLRVLCGTGESC